MESKVLKISDNYFNETADYVSRSLVGKVMKRFEIIDSRDVLKNEVKELIYEEIRHFRDLLIAHDKGLSLTIFEFTNKKKETV